MTKARRGIKCRPNLYPPAVMTPSIRLHTSGPAHRRRTREVMVGKVGIGGDNPIRVQSMITCDTMDTEASIRQTMDLAAVGLRDRAHHRADGQGRAQPGVHQARPARTRLRRAHRGRHPLQARRRDGSRPMGRKGARQSRQLRRLQEIRRQANTPTSSTRRNWSASANGSRRWCGSARSAAWRSASARTTARSATAS